MEGYTVLVNRLSLPLHLPRYGKRTEHTRATVERDQRPESEPKPPDPSSILIHTDTTWIRTYSCTSGVSTDSGGSFIVPWAERSTSHSTLHAKAKAILSATTMALQHGWTMIEIRNDCLEFVEAINRRGQEPWEVNYLFGDIFALNLFFVSWSCIWIPRSRNHMAHDLGQYGLRSESRGLGWFREYSNISTHTTLSNF